jgi:uncharacterized membrane protein YfcA
VKRLLVARIVLPMVAAAAFGAAVSAGLIDQEQADALRAVVGEVLVILGL